MLLSDHKLVIIYINLLFILIMELTQVNKENNFLNFKNINTDIRLKYIQVGGLLENCPSAWQVTFTRSYVQNPFLHS